MSRDNKPLSVCLRECVHSQSGCVNWELALTGSGARLLGNTAEQAALPASLPCQPSLLGPRA